MITWLASAAALSAGAGDFNKKLRDLAADRPDATESPITVDKGHWQVETSVIDFSKDFKFEALTYAETNLKYGLSDTIDLQFIFAPYVEERDKTEGKVNESSGLSDLTLRLKWNLWGNDGGETAFALFPYIKIPTQTEVSNEHWEGGVILPFAYQINERLGLGLQAEFAYVWDDSDWDHDLSFSHTVVLGYALSDDWGVYGEYLGVAGDHSYQTYFSGGCTYSVTAMLQLDIGAIIGLNDASDDLNVFTGFTRKF